MSTAGTVDAGVEREYLINCGGFNIIVLPGRRRYYLLGEPARAAALVAGFVAGEQIPYGELKDGWFEYAADESWHTFDGSERRLNADLSEDELIEHFVLKKFNFGALVALREGPHRPVRVFKRDKLAAGAGV